MKIIKRSLAILLCLLTVTGILPLGATTANAAELPLTKTVSVTVKLNGVHAATDFPATRSYDDGQYTGTLTRQNNTLRNVVRATPTVTYTYQSDIKYPNDKPAAGQYSFPSTYSASYYDSVSGQYFPATLSKSGSPYFSGAVTSTTMYWTHYGYQYDPINHSKLGYMSNNSTTYYGGQLRFSDPPRQPTDYYGPPAEMGLGWVQYQAPDWDGALQDAEQEPWRSICIAYHGVARFEGDTGTLNRYRKPVRIYYRRTANSQYIYQSYSGTATVTDTEITYTGVVSLKLPDLTVTSLTANKSVYEAGESVTVTAIVANQGQTPASNFTARLSTSPTVTTQDKTVSLAAGASATVTYTFTAPTALNSQNITLTVTADANNVIAETNESNNSRSTTIAVNALRPDIEIIDSSITDWYAGKDVVVSATVRNLTAQPVPSVAIRLTVGSASYTESIPIAGNGSNLAVFRFTVPSTIGSYTVRITADPDGVLTEIDESNNILTRNIQVITVPASIVADPDNQAMEQRYRAYGLTNIPAVSPSNYHTWQEVRLEGGSYVIKNFYARLTTTFQIVPDSRIAYPDKPRQMESGFGLSVQCSTILTTNYDRPDKLVGTQMVWIRYPESAYGQLAGWQDVRDDLQVKTGAAGNTAITWQLAVNPYSVIGSRLHYTPLWFPDGGYTAWAQAFYSWSPVGQMYDYKTDTLTISGDMYDRITVIKR